MSKQTPQHSAQEVPPPTDGWVARFEETELWTGLMVDLTIANKHDKHMINKKMDALEAFITKLLATQKKELLEKAKRLPRFNSPYEEELGNLVRYKDVLSLLTQEDA